jgi:hypothetical protein
MAGSVATAGLALAAVGLVGRTLVQKLPQFAPIISARINSVNFENLAPSKAGSMNRRTILKTNVSIVINNN